MRRSVWLGVLGVLALSWFVLPARGATCPGDCSGTMKVLVNDLVTCVSIALDTQALSACSACDVDGSGVVTVNELVAAVDAALDGCPGTTPIPVSPTPTMTSGPICGNGVKEADEDCDPPNPGGQTNPCAANCTTETRRTAMLDPNLSLSPIQTSGVVLATLHVSGTQTLTTGRARDAAVFGPGNKQLFAAGEAPIVVKAEDVVFNPVSVLGLSCACIRAVAVPAFGAGISGVGVAGCGSQGLSNVDFQVEQDHDTTPGSPGNSGSGGLPDDADCTMKSVATVAGSLAAAGNQIVSNACLEGVGANCSGIVGTQSQYTKHFAIPSCVGGTMPGLTCKTNTDCPGSTCVGGPNDQMVCTAAADCGTGACTAAVCKSAGATRPAACNSPRTYTFTGGQAPTGSVMLINNTSQTLLPNLGTVSTCVGGATPDAVCKKDTDCGSGGSCQPNACIATKNADGICSAPTFGPDCMPCTADDTLIVEPMVVPTTSGTASVKIDDYNDNKGMVLGLPNQMCGTKLCITSVSGDLADCDALKNNPDAPLSGALVTASPNLDSEVADVVLTTTLAAQAPASDTTE